MEPDGIHIANEVAPILEPSELSLLDPKIVTLITERKAAIQYAMQIANELGHDVSWRELLPLDFFITNVVVQKVEGDLHLYNNHAGTTMTVNSSGSGFQQNVAESIIDSSNTSNTFK